MLFFSKINFVPKILLICNQRFVFVSDMNQLLISEELKRSAVSTARIKQNNKNIVPIVT